MRQLLLVIVAALASVRASHGTAGGCDCPVLGQRAHLNVGLPNIQCSIQLLCATGCARSIFPKQKCCCLLLLPQLDSVLPLFSKPCVVSITPFWPHFAGDEHGYLLQVLGLCKSMRGCRVQAALGMCFLTCFYFLVEGLGSLQLSLIIMQPN